MSYEGNYYGDLKFAELPDVSGDLPYVLVVSGATPWGHCLLKTQSGCYHITKAGLTYPRHIPSFSDFLRYVNENNKFVLGWLEILDSATDKLAAAVKASLNTSWLYGFVVHNCVNYVESMLEKSGSKFKFAGTNLPTNGLKQSITLNERGIVGRFNTRVEKDAQGSGQRLL
jgi:hypothetical protein